MEGAADLYIQAVNMLPERSIVKEAFQILNKIGKSREVVRLYDNLREDVRAYGRIKMLLIEGLLGAGDIERAEKMLNDNIEVADVREGETKLTDLWFRMTAMKQARLMGVELDDALLEQVKKECIPPVHLDFRMR